MGILDEIASIFKPQTSYIYKGSNQVYDKPQVQNGVANVKGTLVPIYTTAPSPTNTPPIPTQTARPKTTQQPKQTIQPTPQQTQTDPFTDFVPSKVQKRPPADIANLILQDSQKYGVDPNWITAQMYHETAGTFQPNIVGSSGDWGLAQINPASNPKITKEQAFNPEFAVDYMTNRLANALKMHGDINTAIASYNLGDSGVLDPRNSKAKQNYVDNVARNLTSTKRQALGIKTSY